jgi:DNA-directed RNA polymerase subunit alpha
MAILNFQKPDKVIMIDSSEFEGKFEFRPLEPGYGLTVGNALRRVLLSSLEGFAITSVKIENIDHEFSTIPGIVEDVTEIILNLKQVRFKRQIEDIENEKVSIYWWSRSTESFRFSEIHFRISGVEYRLGYL